MNSKVKERKRHLNFVNRQISSRSVKHLRLRKGRRTREYRFPTPSRLISSTLSNPSRPDGASPIVATGNHRHPGNLLPPLSHSLFSCLISRRFSPQRVRQLFACSSQNMAGILWNIQSCALASFHEQIQICF